MATNLLELSEQEIVRRGSLEEMRNRGIDPYPAAEPKGLRLHILNAA